MSHDAIALTDQLLQEWPLPQADGDKETRGRALVIAGSAELPGAARLAGEGALRAGAGKLILATLSPASDSLAVAVPEARVIGLAHASGKGVEAAALERLIKRAAQANAIVIGPGIDDEDAACTLARALWRTDTRARFVLDATAMSAVCTGSAQHEVVITPHAGEMAHLTGRDKDAVLKDPLGSARDAAQRWRVVVVLKGAVTHVAAPDGHAWRHEGGNAGLATSGSGDVLAGLIGGLVARGAPLSQAAAWGVRLHARAGERLAQRAGTLGYLARELLYEIPALLEALAPRQQRRIGFG
jgi:ADP-dependent NAD(P)H-hydrate dehydratase